MKLSQADEPEWLFLIAPLSAERPALRRGFIGVKVRPAAYGFPDLWYCPELSKWLTLDDPERNGESVTNTHYGEGSPNSYKAFKKYLKRRGAELKDAMAVTLVSKWASNDIYAVRNRPHSKNPPVGFME